MDTTTSTNTSAAGDLGALISRARGADAAAFAALYAQSSPWLERYLSSRLEAAEIPEMAARIWIDVAFRIDQAPTATDEFTIWLARLARQTLAHRAAGHLGIHDLQARRLLKRVTLDDGHGGHFSAATITGHAAVSRIVTAMPSDQVEAVVLPVVLDCDITALARILGCGKPGADMLVKDAGDALESIFGRAEASKLLDRIATVEASEPPTGLLDAMVAAATPKRRGGVSRTWAAAGIAGAVLLGTASGAAAGVLPAAVTAPITSVANVIGIGGDDSSDEITDAYEAPTSEAVEAGNADEDNHGATVSDLAKTTEAEGRDKGAEISGVASDGKRPEEPGQPENKPADVGNGKPDAPEQSSAPAAATSKGGGNGKPAGKGK